MSLGKITDRSDVLDKEPKTERRQRVQSDTQRHAAVENFAIFLLKGIKAAANNPRAATVFSIHFVDFINNMTDFEITRIKQLQQLRKDYIRG